MRNWLKAAMLLIAVAAMMATPALAAEYEFDDSDGPMYAPPTSVDQVIVVGGGATESATSTAVRIPLSLHRHSAAQNPTCPGPGHSVPQASTSHRGHHQRGDNLPPTGFL